MLLTVAMMLFGFSARAGSIDEEQARAKALSFLQSRRPAQANKRLVRAATPAELRNASIDEANLYVFNVGEHGGFVIIAGDDCARPVLGYADSGTFDYNHLPAALNEMLTIYASQIERLGQTENKSDSTVRVKKAMRRTSSIMADVAPLLSTTWNQADPYNAYCPTQNDATALTGCVATAMAQIANYHKYPTGEVPSLESYTSETNKINVSAWGSTTFDWDNMLDSYSGSYSSEQEAAVATLMRYCGQAAKMDYGFTSGAYNGDALNAFKEKLGYNANADFKSAANYSANAWEDIIYKEVAEGRPVYYSALNGDSGDVGGHAFVIDGYQSEGSYFHVNWGWGGACDGYFNLFALDPNAPESPVTTAGWHYQMLAIIGLSPETVNASKLMQDASGSYLITSADDWNELSANLENYNSGSFKLTDNISVTTMVGTRDIPFQGTFDGQGHVLSVNIESDLEGTAPFCSVYTGTVIKNLKTQGTVSCSGYHASGLIGTSMNEDNFPIAITNCEVAVQINGNSHCGGFIGHARCMQPTFTDCVFSGSITSSSEYGCFVGWKEHESRPVYINCLSIPTSICDGNSYDFSHPGNGGSEDHATLTNCYYSYAGGFSLAQGMSASSDKLANGSVTHALQNGSREWTNGQVWGQLIGTDAAPMLTDDTNKGVYKVSFAVDGHVVKAIVTNSHIGDKMPSGEDFGLSNAQFSYNGTTFDSKTNIGSNITVNVTGTNAYTMTVGKPANGSITVNNNTCIPGTLKKVTVIPSEGYVTSAVKVTDANNAPLPVTQVSNAVNEYVFTFPKSSVKVEAEFIEGEAETAKFINCGLTLPSSWRDQNQHWTADTWTIWGAEYDGTNDVIVGTPPTDAMGHKWYEEGYELTNSDDVVQPNGNKIVWENHAASFRDGGDYDYFAACGASGDRFGDFYIRRIFTFNTQSVPSKLYLSCSYDDSPVEYYINGTLVYQDHKSESWHEGCFEIELTPDQIALIHTDGTPNVLAAHASQNMGGYHLDCGLYDPTTVSYEVTGDHTVRVQPNAFITGDITIPETITYKGVTYTVTELADNAFNNCNGLTSVILPSTMTNVGNNVFSGCDNLQHVKSPVSIYQNETLIAAAAGATEFELPIEYSKIYRNAFKYTENLTKLILPRSLTHVGENAFAGCKTLTEIYAYSFSAPSTEGNAFDGVDKKSITVHVYESALDSYKQTWGEDFTYITMTNPESVALSINVENTGSLRSLIEAGTAEKESSIYDVVGITVTGTINNDDMRVLSEMCTDVYALAAINLGNANIEGNRIEYRMFADREKLTSIILPETLEYIDEEAFINCRGLTSIDIPASVKGIRNYAFMYCNNLAEVTGMEGLSDNNSYEAWDVFQGTAITKPVYGGTVFLYLPPSMTGEYEVPAGIKMTAAGAMRNSQLSAITLPASITDLGDDTFQDCPYMVDIYSYASVPPTCHSGVWENGFNKDACIVHVPASLVDDYKNADEWRDFRNIVGIAIGELVDMTLHVETAGTLDDALFDAAVAAAEISDKVLVRNLTVTGNINADDVSYLNALPATLYNLQMLDLSGAALENNTITERMFYASNYKTIKLPTTVTDIASEAFSNSRRLNSITLPESLKSIGSSAFASTALTSIIIPDGVTEMGDRVMQHCGALTSVKIGNGVKFIPECWAEFSENLEEVTIGKQVSDIYWRAFYGKNIKHVYCHGKVPSGWNDSFYDGLNPDAILHVCSNCENRYKNANGWKDFPTIVGDQDAYPEYDITVDVEANGTFSEVLPEAMAKVGCEDKSEISKLTVTGNINNDDLNYIRDNVGATLDALDLGEVTVENNIMTDASLRGCGFEELVLPKNLGDLYFSALSNCVNLKALDIPNSVKEINSWVCDGATSLETVTGGNGVESGYWRDGAFSNCPNLKSPVILNNIFFRLPMNTVDAYVVPENVTQIAGYAMSNIGGLISLTLPEGVNNIGYGAFDGSKNLRNIYCYAVEVPSIEGFEDFDRASCTLHVYEEMVEVFKANEVWTGFNIIGDLGAMPVLTPMNEADYTALCDIYNKLNGEDWTVKWIINKNIQTASRWRGVSFDEDGYVTSIDLRDKGLRGDISTLIFTGLTRLTSLDLSYNTITGDLQPLKNSLPAKCALNVKEQNLGYIGEHTLYELCQYGGLPSIAYYNSDNGTFVSTLIGVAGECKFAHEGTDGGEYWDCYIHANGETYNNNKFYWESPVTVECRYPHRFTFTYKYEMGDANMDDALNVLDLQTTLNYSNGTHWGLFNFHAADTYEQDDEINVQDIVATVNILLAQENNESAEARAFGATRNSASEAWVSAENGQLVLYTTKPVAALDLHIADIKPDDITWNVETMGFATASMIQGDNTHVIIYSMQDRQIEEGKTVLATFDASLSPCLASATLCDSKAQAIRVGRDVTTGIIGQIGNHVDSWSVTDLSGLRIASGSHDTEADILRLMKSRRIHGVFILEMDGVRRKIVIQ